MSLGGAEDGKASDTTLLNALRYSKRKCQVLQDVRTDR